MRPSSTQAVSSASRPTIRRRRVLVTALVVSTIALAGCQGGGTEKGDLSKHPKRFGSEFNGTNTWSIGNQR